MEASDYIDILRQLDEWSNRVCRYRRESGSLFAPPEFTDEISLWLPELTSRITRFTNDRVTPDQRVEPSLGWRHSAFRDAQEIFALRTSGQGSNVTLDTTLRTYETHALTTFGFEFRDAVAIATALPRLEMSEQYTQKWDDGTLGDGITALAVHLQTDFTAKARDRLFTIAELLRMLSRSRLATRLSAAIEADGKALTVLGDLFDHSIAAALCRLSQLLADAKGYYEAGRA